MLGNPALLKVNTGSYYLKGEVQFVVKRLPSVTVKCAETSQKALSQTTFTCRAIIELQQAFECTVHDRKLINFLKN